MNLNTLDRYARTRKAFGDVVLPVTDGEFRLCIVTSAQGYILSTWAGSQIDFDGDLEFSDLHELFERYAEVFKLRLRPYRALSDGRPDLT